MAALLTPAGAGAQVTVTPVGTPAYQIVDTRLFAAPQGFDPNFEPFTATIEQIFPNHFPVRVPHAGPYDTELSEGLARAGFADRTANPLFDVSEFTAPSGVFFGLMRVPVPNAPIGSSPDFASGPIVPNAAFPLIVRGDVFRNGAIFDANAFVSTSNPVAGFDGSSHNLNLFAENGSFVPAGTDLTGDYEYRLTYRDVATGTTGYNVSARFRVAQGVIAIPEPGTSTLVAVGLLTLLASAAARRRAQQQLS